MTTSLIPSTETAINQIEAIQDTYTEHVKHFTAWLRGTGNDFTIDAVHDYFTELNRSDLAVGTVRFKRAAVKKRLHQLMMDAPNETQARLNRELAELENGETRAPKLNTPEVGSEKVLSQGEVDRLVSDARSCRQAMFIRFLYLTGCRISEMLDIRHDRCMIDGTRVVITIRGKGNKERKIRIPETFYTEIQQCFGLHDQGYVFCTSTGKRYTRQYVTDQIHKLGKHVLNRSVSAHTLRHSFVTTHIRNGKPIDAISRYVGHSNVTITLAMYAHNQMSDADLFGEEI